MIADFNWDDFRLILAVSRTSSLKEAAQVLKVKQITVARRLKAFEENVGELFIQKNSNPQPNQTCLDLIQIAEGIEQELYEFSSEVFDIDKRLSGTLRVATTDFFASIWAEDFAYFRKQFPDLNLEISTSYDLKNLSKREADVSIRIMKGSPPEHLIGKRLAKAAFAFYSSKKSQKAESNNYWISYDSKSNQNPLDKLIYKIDENAEIKVRVDSVYSQASMLKAGLGIGLLPCALGDTFKGIKRVSPLLPDYQLDLWLLTHPEIQRTARIRAFMNFFSQVIKKHRLIIEGQGGVS